MSRLREARLSKAWSQARLAEEITVAASRVDVPVAKINSLKVLISRWENSHAVPEEPYRQLLAVTLGVSMQELGLPVVVPDRLSVASLDHGASSVEIESTPLLVDGKVQYVPLDRRNLLAAMISGGVMKGVTRNLVEPAGNDPTKLGDFPSIDFLTGFLTQRWRGARILVGDLRNHKDTLSFALPGTSESPGAVLSLAVEPRGVADGDLVNVERTQSRRATYASFNANKIHITSAADDPQMLYVLGGRSAARQLRDNSRSLSFPKSYMLDDFTFALLWGATYFDQPLLDDDSLLAQRRVNPLYRGGLAAPDVADDLTADLSPISRMWMGSDFCARFIVKSFDRLSGPPRFWTREQRGQEACAWLFFAHKFLYLQEGFRRTGHLRDTAMSRSFCIPEDITRSSPSWEKILLFFAVALMESLGIVCHVITDPALSNVDGIAMVPGSQAVIANWVRAENAWVTGLTSSRSLLRSYTENIFSSIQQAINVGDTAPRRLQSLAAYLGLSWHSLGSRSEDYVKYPPGGVYTPRSRLLSMAGLERALRFVAGMHKTCGCKNVRFV